MDSAIHAVFYNNDGILFVKASTVDRLEWCSSRNAPEGQTPLEKEQYYPKVIQRSEWLREWAIFLLTGEGERFSNIYRPREWHYDPSAGNEQFEILTYRPTGESLRDAYLRTLLADAVLDDKEGHDTRVTSAEQYTGVEQGLDVRRRGQFLLRYGYRALSISHSGWLCLVPLASRTGDIIAIVQGAELPFIVRESGQGSYHFIGLAYVHGIMDGEIWNDIKDQLQEISLV